MSKSHRIFYVKTFPILLAIFGLSILVRIPNLNRPLSKHHEFCTAVALIPMTVWSENGIRNFHYDPVMNFQNPADKNINNGASSSGKMKDVNGNFYYVSHPPFAYLLPFFIFSLLHIKVSVLSLQLFHVSIHFVSALFVYFIVNLLSVHRGRDKPFIPSIVAFAVYVFLPVTMWFQSNVYMSDMLVQVFYIISIYVLLKMIMRNRFNSVKYNFFLSLLVFCAAYTSWLGYLMALVFVIYLMNKARYETKALIPLFLTVSIVLLAFSLTFYQYAQIGGYRAYLAELFVRYKIRGTIDLPSAGWFSLFWVNLMRFKTLLVNYLLHYHWVFAWIAFVFLFSMSQSKLKFVFTRYGYLFLLFSVVPIVMLHLFLLEYSHHDFTVLYAALPLAVIIGVFYDKLSRTQKISVRRLNIIIACMLLMFIAEYYLQNLPGKKSIKGAYYAQEKELGENLSKNALPDEVIYYDEKVSPIVVYYAKRNIAERK